MFWDVAEVEVRAGRGGDGLTSFLQEKYREKGGPDGGDGGDGGDVWFQVELGGTTLSWFRTRRLLRAGDGQPGRKRRSHGRSGEDLTVSVPPGTIVYDDGRILADLREPGQRFRAARGGGGGYGNAHFTSSTRQTPEVAELGDPGEEKSLRLELKLIADVGLIGLPNAGKSTLLARISAAKPKIAAYPFTTTIPNLGVVERRGFTFVAADIPGLIEGAHQGKGLGHEFLRHVERCRLLVHLVDGTSSDLGEDYETVRRELRAFNPKLIGRPELVVINKIDQPEAKGVSLGRRRIDHRISAATGEGVDALLGEVAEHLQRLPAPEVARQAEPEMVRFTPESDPELFLVEKKGKGFTVSGGKIERFARRLDLSKPPAQLRLRDIMERLGVTRELLRQGAREGDPVTIGTRTLPFRSPRVGTKKRS